MVRSDNRITVVAVFRDRRQAQEALNELRAAGFREDELGLVAHDTGDGNGRATHEEGHGTKTGEGAAIGVATGAGVGALWAVGIAAGLLPAIGPVIAGGLLASILASAAGGAAAAGIAGALIGLGVPEDEADYYEGEFRSGRILVTVRAEDRRDEAWEILSRHGGYDVESGQDHVSGRGTPGAATATNSGAGPRTTHLRKG